MQHPQLNLITEAQSFRMDCETPVSLYLKLATEQTHSFILESVEQGNHGRYSFLGWDALIQVAFRPGIFEVNGAIEELIELPDDPLAELKRLIKQVNLLDKSNVPDSRDGFVGYFGYDVIRLIEEIGEFKGDPNLPWFELILPRFLLVFDHIEHHVSLYCNEPVGDGGEQEARRVAKRAMEKVTRKIQSLSVANLAFPKDEEPINMDEWQTNLTEAEYCELVARAKRHIVDGDIFQVVLSRAVRREFNGDPFEVYRTLRGLNPSPYMYYLAFDGRVTVGGSPEALVSLSHGVLTTKPIAGTRPRGMDLDDDLRLEQDLLSDAKEIAEHLMLVDLGRNDLGRIAEAGSVSVPKFKVVEHYSHVMHIVSIVQAKLRKDCEPLDALMSVFPAGTLSGAPKIKAMQIIDQFEPETRGIYGGAIGFLDFEGNLDTCIAIRTAVIEGHEVRVQAGAGIVADSVPEKEFAETHHKMMSMVVAVEHALRRSSYSH
jgi:anthranilate synthase component 1